MLQLQNILEGFPSTSLRIDWLYIWNTGQFRTDKRWGLPAWRMYTLHVTRK
jgi:hypothetical protein